MPVFTTPKFEVKRHGFQFNNTYQNTELINDVLNGLGINFPFPIPDFSFGNPIRTGGRCGGMTYAALDFFLSPKFDAPLDIKETPPDGDVLSDYILKRQYDSFYSVGDEFIANVTIPGEGSKFYLRCLPPSGHDFLMFKECIKKNECRPLALLPIGGLVGHQVLGIGFTDNPDPEKVLIHIYDSNYRNQEIVLKLNKSKEYWERRHYENGEVGNMTGRSHAYKAWIPADGYKFNDPNIYDTASTLRNYAGRDLRNWNPPPKEDLTHYVFENANFYGNKSLKSCDFENVNASGAVFIYADVSKCDFRSANLRKSNFTNANLRGSTFNKAKIANANFSNTELSDAHFRAVDGEGVPTFFMNAKLNNTDFREAILEGIFTGAAIVQSNFNKAKIAESQFINSAINTTNFQAAVLDDTAWLKVALADCDFSRIEIKKEVFEATSVQRANFSNAAINNCDFTGASCSQIGFPNASLNSIVFLKSDLRKANFLGAVLSNINFLNANLSYAKFDGAALDNIDFRGVNYTGSSWRGANVKNAKMYSSMRSYLQRQGAAV